MGGVEAVQGGGEGGPGGGVRGWGVKEEFRDECFITSRGILDGWFLLRNDRFFGAL